MADIFEKLYKRKRTVFSYKKPDGEEEELIVLDATLQEKPTSTIESTDHPVEEGFDISDHVHIKPKELSIEGIVSDSPITIKAALVGNVAGASSAIGGIGGTIATGAIASLGGALLNKSKNRVQDSLSVLLDMQNKKQLMTVVTGLQVYENMILQNFNPIRDTSTGGALRFSANLKEIRIVQSEVITLDEAKTADSSAIPKQKLSNQTTKKTSDAVAAKASPKASWLVKLFGK